MSVKLKIERNKYLFLRIYQNGIRKVESLPLRLTGDAKADKEIKRTAEEIRLKRELQVVRGEYDLIDHIGAKKTLYSYIEELASNRDNKDSLYKVLRYLKQYPDSETIQLKQITSNWIESLQNYLLKQSGLERNSVVQYMAAIRSALNRAVRNNLILKNPANSVKAISAEEKIHSILTIDEIQTLYNTPMNSELGEEIKRAFIFGCFSGLRISDLQTLKWENIEHRNNKIYLIKVQKKTKTKIGSELNKTAYEMIRDDKLHNRNDYVFPFLSTTKTNTNRYLKQWAKKANIDKSIGWHTGRRSNATLLLESGAAIPTIQKLLGHGKITTTMKYTQTADRAMNEAANALPGIVIDKEKMN
ncbi:MAG: site-specific integrase [Spirochaetaceae bacterium]|nr:site-specific integrase [Spirochaetaceae bacterium]